MKRSIFKKLILCICVLIFCAGLFGCAPEGSVEPPGTGGNEPVPGTSEPPEEDTGDLTAEVVSRIKQSYLNQYAFLVGSTKDKTTDDVRIKMYLGTYNGYPAVVMDGLLHYPAVVCDFVIGDVTFRYCDGSRIFLWKERESFWDLRRAYQAEMLTREDLAKISDCYDLKKTFNPLPPLTLDEETERQIMQDFGGFLIKGFYGIYNGWAVLRIPMPTAAISITEFIDDVLFCFSDTSGLHVWKDGEIQTFEEFYKTGTITRENLIKIANYNAEKESSLYRTNYYNDFWSWMLV